MALQDCIFEDFIDVFSYKIDRFNNYDQNKQITAYLSFGLKSKIMCMCKLNIAYLVLLNLLFIHLYFI